MSATAPPHHFKPSLTSPVKKKRPRSDEETLKVPLNDIIQKALEELKKEEGEIEERRKKKRKMEEKEREEREEREREERRKSRLTWREREREERKEREEREEKEEREREERKKREREKREIEERSKHPKKQEEDWNRRWNELMQQKHVAFRALRHAEMCCLKNDQFQDDATKARKELALLEEELAEQDLFHPRLYAR